jgi:hypothetical protein
MMEAFRAHPYPTEVQAALFTKAVALRCRYFNTHSNV